LRQHGGWQLRVSATEIFLADEAVVHPSPRLAEETSPGKEEQLPFLLYRDGIRAVTFLADPPRHEFDALFEALLAASASPVAHDDLVTLLWQANPVRILIEAVPLSQTIYLSSRRSSAATGAGQRGQAFAWSPSGSEIRADIGQLAGVAQGLHRDTFDDWPLPDEHVEVPEAYERLIHGIQFVRTQLVTEWGGERAVDWTVDAPVVLRRALALDPGDDMRAALASALVTWVAGTLLRSAWSELQTALELMREIDPGGALTHEPLTQAIAGLDSDTIAQRLDESETDDQARFFGLAVAIGRPALGLACAVMAKAARSRTRAAACTMLSYLCSDQPELLAPYLSDSRWYVVRNAVFVLGQIGGPEVVELLRGAAVHPDPRVRRQVMQALGGVPSPHRLPILIGQLDTRDPQLLGAALAMLARERSPRIAAAILKQIAAPDFESRSEDNQRALFGALAENADDAAVPTLELLLHKGGWFARRSFERTAAARTLQRIGTPLARAAIEAGLRSRSEAVRQACLEATAPRHAP
jgi:HEAT repeat protein